MNEHTFNTGSLAGTKVREMEPVKERVQREFKHFLFDCIMNGNSIQKGGSGIMKGEFEDGCEDRLAENSLPAVSLGLELNERSVVYQQLRDPDRAAVPRLGRRPDARSVHAGTAGGATEGATRGAR
jgi:hypothetical protein